MASQRSLREVALERTFSLYLTHFALWLALLLPVIATGAVIFLAVRSAIVGTLGPEVLPETVKAAMAAPWTAVLVWALAGVGGGQICALLVLDRRPHGQEDHGPGRNHRKQQSQPEREVGEVEREGALERDLAQRALRSHRPRC